LVLPDWRRRDDVEVDALAVSGRLLGVTRATDTEPFPPLVPLATVAVPVVAVVAYANDRVVDAPLGRLLDYTTHFRIKNIRVSINHQWYTLALVFGVEMLLLLLLPLPLLRGWFKDDFDDDAAVADCGRGGIQPHQGSVQSNIIWSDPTPIAHRVSYLQLIKGSYSYSIAAIWYDDAVWSWSLWW
jgi:hypothetical protein